MKDSRKIVLNDFAKEASLTVALMLVKIAQPLNALIVTRLLSLSTDHEAVPAYDIIQNAEQLVTAIFLIFIQFADMPFGRIYGKYKKEKTEGNRSSTEKAFSAYSLMGTVAGVIPSLIMATAMPAFLNLFDINPNYINVAQQYFLIRGIFYCVESTFLMKQQMSLVIEEQWKSALFTGAGAFLVYAVGSLLFLNSGIQADAGSGVALALSVQAIAQWVAYFCLIRFHRKELSSKCCEYDKAVFKKNGIELIKLVLPFLLVNLGYVAAGFFRSVTFNHMSTEAVNTDLVTTKYTQLFQGLGAGVTTASAIQASKMIGAGNLTDIKRPIGYNLLLILLMNALWFIVAGASSSNGLIGLVSPSIQLDSGAFKRYLMLMSLGQLFDTAAFPLGGLLLGLYDICYFVGVTTVSPIISGGMGYLLTKTSLGIDGMSIGFIIGNLFSLAAIVGRLAVKHKKLFTDPEGYGQTLLAARRSSDVALPVTNNGNHTDSGSDPLLESGRMSPQRV